MSKFKHEFKIVLLLGFPLMASFLAQKGIQLVEIIMMGRIGPHALAAGALGTSLFSLLLVFCMGTISAVGVFLSRAIGANRYEDIESILLSGFCLALFLSIPCMMLLWDTSAILSLAGENPDAIADAQIFLRALLWGMPGFLGFLVLREFVSAFFLSQITMVIALIAIPITFLCNYVLIYGKLGFPAMGIAGIGYSGSLVQWLMFFGMLGYCGCHSTLKPYIKKIREYKKWPWIKIYEIAYIGTPSGFFYVLDVGMIFTAALMMGHFSEDALAAHQIAIMYVSTSYAPYFALSMTTALRIGHAMGANNLQRVKISTHLGLLIGIIISIFVACVFLLAPKLLVEFFISSQDKNFNEIKQLATILLGIAALFQIGDAIQAIYAGALRGLKDTWVPMLFSMLCYWPIGVGSSYVLGFLTPLGPSGIWYGLTLGILSVAIVLSLRFKERFNREKTFFEKSTSK